MMADMYAAKGEDYFGQTRFDIVDALPANARARVLEVGCGRGGTGKAILAAGKAGYYRAVEIDPASAAIAGEALTDVTCGNVERMDLSALGAGYDVLILSEVLEHLLDPWDMVRRLSALLEPGGFVFASVPNVCHRRVIRSLLRGDFTYAPMGVMDRTHLRWFTPATFGRMFEEAGL